MPEEQEFGPVATMQWLINLLLAFVLGGAYTIRLVSRMPTTIGGMHVLSNWFWGSIAMLLFCNLFMQSLHPFAFWYGWALFWLALIHLIAWFFFGRKTHSYHVGRGWLRRWRSESWTDLASDGLVSTLLFYVSWEYRDQGMMAWSLLAFGCSLMTDFIMETRDELRDRKSLDAKLDMEYQMGRVREEIEDS